MQLIKMKSAIIKILVMTSLSVLISLPEVNSQAVPGKDENIPFLVTFGKMGETSWGDANFYGVFFFTIPKDFNRQFYIKVFDTS